MPQPGGVVPAVGSLPQPLLNLYHNPLHHNDFPHSPANENVPRELRLLFYLCMACASHGDWHTNGHLET